MTNEWLGPTEGVNVDAIQAEIEERLQQRANEAPLGGALLDSAQTAADTAADLRQTMLPSFASEGAPSNAISLTEADCDIVPRDYVIDWQHPLLGPINARVRQVINAEIRRYLTATLEQQSFVNRQLLQSIQQLQAENAELRKLIERG